MDPVEFGNYLRKQRKNMSMTVREIERLSGVSQSYITNIENGKRSVPSPDILRKLSDPLGIPYADLMKKAGYFPDTVLAPALLSDTEATIVNIGQNIIDVLKEMRAETTDIYDIRKIDDFGNRVLTLMRERESIERADISVSELRGLLFDVEPDGDMLPRFGSIEHTETINRLLFVLDTAIRRDANLQNLKIRYETTKEALRYLEQTDIAYNGHPLTAQDRKRILTMLEVLFPEYQQPPAIEHEVD